MNGRVFVGTASFVAARVRTSPPRRRLSNYRAGWGYLMLTRGLIWDGAGTFRLYAIATDTEGNTTELGAKIVSINNSIASKPFGNIDSPGPGATVIGGIPVPVGS